MTNSLLNGNVASIESNGSHPAILTRFKVGINTETVNKADKNKLSKVGAFKPVELTMQGLAEHHSNGHPWMPALLDNDARRCKESANLAYVLGADIDGGMTIAEALEHPFIKAHCGLGIESASSSPELEKYRLVFRLSEPLQGHDTIELCNRYLIHLLGVADPSCKDACRYYFGASGRAPFLLSDVVSLPSNFEAQAKTWEQSQPKPAKPAAKKIIATPTKQTKPNLEGIDLSLVEGIEDLNQATKPVIETTSGVCEGESVGIIEFLNSVLKPAYLALPIPDQYKTGLFDPELREVSPGEWRGFNPFGDTGTNPDAFSVSVRADGSTVWAAPSTSQGGNVWQFLCLQKFREDTAKGKNFWNFIKILEKATGKTVPKKVQDHAQKRNTELHENQRQDDIRKLLGDESADLYFTYPMATPDGVQLQIEQVTMQALFSKPWLQAEGNLYRFNGEYYEAVDDATVSADISKFLDIYPTLKIGKKGVEIWGFDFASEGFVKRCLAWVKMRVPSLRESSHLICFKNCVLNVVTGEQRKHSPQWHLTSQIQSDYFRGSECPKTFSDFITDAYGAEYLEVFQAITSMFIDPSCMYGKAVHLVGQSGGGKGTTIRFLGSLFDPASVQSLGAFADLATPEKRHQNLRSKNFVSLPDLGGFQQGLQAWFELVDNGSMSGRKLLSSDAYSKQWGCRFILASVSELKIENGGDGWARRTITLRVKNRKGKPDRTLSKKLEAVRSEVISWALSMSKERRDEILENPEIVAPAIARDNHQSSIVGDAVKTFLDSCFSRSEISDSRISNTELYQMYSSYYRVTNTGKPMGLNNFVSHLKVIIPDNFKDRKKSKGSKVYDIPSGFSGLCGLPDVFRRSQDAFNDELVCNLDKTVEGSFYTEFAVTDTEPETKLEVETAIETIGKGQTTSVCVEERVIKEFAEDILFFRDDVDCLESTLDEILNSDGDIIEQVWDIVFQRLENSPTDHRNEVKAIFAVVEQNARSRKARGELYKPAKKLPPGNDNIPSPEYEQTELSNFN